MAYISIVNGFELTQQKVDKALEKYRSDTPNEQLAETLEQTEKALADLVSVRSAEITWAEVEQEVLEVLGWVSLSDNKKIIILSDDTYNNPIEYNESSKQNISLPLIRYEIEHRRVRAFSVKAIEWVEFEIY